MKDITIKWVFSLPYSVDYTFGRGLSVYKVLDSCFANISYMVCFPLKFFGDDYYNHSIIINKKRILGCVLCVSALPDNYIIGFFDWKLGSIKDYLQYVYNVKCLEVWYYGGE